MNSLNSEHTYSERTKRRRIKAIVDEHVQAIALDVEYELNADDSAAQCTGDSNINLSSPAEIVNFCDKKSQICDYHHNVAILHDFDSACISNVSDCDDVYTETDSEVDDEDMVSDVEDKRCIRTQLAEWAVSFNVSHVALSALLSVLQANNIDVPKDPRTLLSTPKTTDITQIAGGSYHHRGITHSIACAARSKLHEIQGTHALTLDINIDGLPLFKSSNIQLWPILGMIRELPGSSPFVIGLFSGNSKPTPVHDFLHDFVEEMRCLDQHGLIIDGIHYSIIVGAIVCDAPARAYVKCIKGHSGYNSCERCTTEGVYVNGRMTFPELSAAERTDEDFDSMTSEDHHTSVTPLKQLGIGCVSQFPLDYMHLVCLGVVRRLILLWLKGPLVCRLGSSSVKSVSGELLSMRAYLPKEFCRKPRAMSEVMHWKATEFRQFLLYTGPIALQGILKDCVYRNFMVLSVAITLLLTPGHCQQYCDYAKQLLSVFVQNFISIYGSEYVSYNVHSILHLPDDARKFGALDGVSAFRFESYLGRLKKMVRRSQNPISQLVRRIDEMQDLLVGSRTADHPKFKKPHSDGPLPPCMSTCSQYKIYLATDREISCCLGDNCYMIDGEICIVRNILVSPSGTVSIVCEQFKNIQSFYQYPLNSLSLGVSLVSNLSGKLNIVSVGAVGKKNIMLPYKDSFVIMPLLHQ